MLVYSHVCGNPALFTTGLLLRKRVETRTEHVVSLCFTLTLCPSLLKDSAVTIKRSSMYMLGREQTSKMQSCPVSYLPFTSCSSDTPLKSFVIHFLFFRFHRHTWASYLGSGLRLKRQTSCLVPHCLPSCAPLSDGCTVLLPNKNGSGICPNNDPRGKAAKDLAQGLGSPARESYI